MVSRPLEPLWLPALLAAFLAAGCSRPDRSDHLWGKRGVQDGDFVRPRAAVIDRQDRLWIVDFTARIQAFDLDGRHLGITFRTPDFRNGRPSGLGLDRYGQLIVCDSHYHCLRVYSPEGVEVRMIGGVAGKEPGQFGYISDVVQDTDGFYYVSEFGENDRITKLDPDGRLVACWGRAGVGPGEFQRLRALALGPDGFLYAADACNHRIQVFHLDGTFVREFGGEGTDLGRLSYPYDLAFSPDGSLYVVEYGNQRIQKFTAGGQPLGVWGAPGGAPGQLNRPWAIVVDGRGRVHVIDTENHRVQRVRF
jgi:DNA-binding beta-propeller fold protein YncE